MYKRITLLLLLFTRLYGYGAESIEKQCNYLKKLPNISHALYNEFGDSHSALSLYSNYEHYLYDYSHLYCLQKDTFQTFLLSYAKYASLSGRERSLEKLIKHYPHQNELLKYMGDLYKNISYDPKNSHRHAEYRYKALQFYRDFLEKGGKQDKHIKRFLTNKGLQKAKNRWFEKFHIQEVPTGSFKVLYFNSKEPKNILHTSRVPYPAVNYNNDDFPGYKIPSNNFAAYWVGDFVFESPVEKEINLRVSWSEYRLIIDGMEVSKSVNKSTITPYHFTKGKHRIELEYINNYGSTDFMMTIYDKRSLLETNKIKEKLPENYLLFYAGLYESARFNNSLQLVFKEKYDTPIVLLLHSYGNIHWKIYPKGNTIHSIFVSSSRQGSLVDIKDKQTTQVNYLKDFSGPTSLRKKCKCLNHSAFCAGSEVSKFSHTINNIFNHHLDGFATLYPRDRLKNKPMLIPEVFLDQETEALILKEEQKAREVENDCRKDRSLGIDDIF